jgi:3-oxoacyl-[acyl-carrier-protein] synthase-3
MVRSRLVGAGGALPARIVSNAEIEDRLGLERGWIGRTGVRERRVLGDDAGLADLAERAARTALDRAGIAAAALDAVIVATTSGPYLFPSLACLVHARLGLGVVPAFDVGAACAGFPYALAVADQGIRAGDYRTVLVVGADCLTTVVDPADRGTAPLFGDGAGAVVLRADTDETRGILVCRLRALGALWELLRVPAGARRVEELARGAEGRWMRMDGPEVFRTAVEQLVALTREALAAVHLTPADVALFVPHQANIRIIRMMLQLLGIEEARAAINLDRYGNTSAASIPIALAEALAAGRIAARDPVVLNAVGGGITAGAVVARW